MYRPLSDEEKAKVLKKFSLGYTTRISTAVDDLLEDQTPIVVQLRYNEYKIQKPVEIFTMNSKERKESGSCFFHDLEEVEHVGHEKGRAKAIRVFLLDLLIKELLDYLKEERYKFIFMYSTIAHIPEVFMDHKFKIRATEKASGVTKFLGYRGI